jgi:hypothetical protein
MALLFQIGHQVFPEQTPELLLSRSGRQIGNLVMCSVALCTMALDAQVGQEGVGKADQMQVCHGRPVGAMLVLTEPQQLLHIFQPRLNGPAFVVRPDDVRGGEFRSVRDEPEDLVGRAFAREDHVQWPSLLTSSQPASTKR